MGIECDMKRWRCPKKGREQLDLRRTFGFQNQQTNIKVGGGRQKKGRKGDGQALVPEPRCIRLSKGVLPNPLEPSLTLFRYTRTSCIPHPPSIQEGPTSKPGVITVSAAVRREVDLSRCAVFSNCSKSAFALSAQTVSPSALPSSFTTTFQRNFARYSQVEERRFHNRG